MTTEGRDDKELVDAIADQDRGALEDFYHKYASSVYSLARKRCFPESTRTSGPEDWAA